MNTLLAKSVKGIVSVMALMSMLGCLNNNRNPAMTGVVVSQSQYTQGIVSAPGNLSGLGGSSNDFTCPSDANVRPDQGLQEFGPGNFRACVSRSNLGTLRLYGYVENSATYCVLPVQVNAQNIPQVLTQPNDPTQAYSLCGASQTDGTVFALAGSNFNAIVVVPQHDLAQMSRCMVLTGYYDCPRYSYGRLR